MAKVVGLGDSREGQSWEEIASEIATLKEAREAVDWSLADLALKAVERFGRGAIGQVASLIGESEGFTRQRVAAAKAFPPGGSRLPAPGLSFSQYRAAAVTEEPQGWIERAVNEGLSYRDLKAAIKAGKGQGPDRVAETDEIMQAEEEIQRVLTRWNERFAEKMGRKAVLSWVPVQSEKTAGPSKTASTA